MPNKYIVFLFKKNAFHQEAVQFLFTFCHKGGIICVSEVIDISPSNLDSSCYIMLRNSTLEDGIVHYFR